MSVSECVRLLPVLELGLLGTALGGHTTQPRPGTRRHAVGSIFLFASPNPVKSFGAVVVLTSHDDSWKEDVENLAAFYADDSDGAATAHGSAPGRVRSMVKDPRPVIELCDCDRSYMI